MAGTEYPSLRDWRQGSILPQNVARDLDLICAQDSETHRVIVVSHDCDIVNVHHEPDVEVIVGQLVSTVDGNLTGGKNSRKLHLDWSHRDGIRTVELYAGGKRRFPKSALATVLPDARYTLDEKDLLTLRFWLGARYNRSAFPDEFNNRLRKTKVGEDIIKTLKPLGKSGDRGGVRNT